MLSNPSGGCIVAHHCLGRLADHHYPGASPITMLPAALPAMLATGRPGEPSGSGPAGSISDHGPSDGSPDECPGRSHPCPSRPPPQPALRVVQDCHPTRAPPRSKDSPRGRPSACGKKGCASDTCNSESDSHFLHSIALPSYCRHGGKAVIALIAVEICRESVRALAHALGSALASALAAAPPAI